MTKFQLPYHFVGNDAATGRILEDIVPHAGKKDAAASPANGKELFSGEFKVKLTCLTPFFTGGERYIEEDGKFEKKPKDDTDHLTYIAPLTYPSPNYEGRQKSNCPDPAHYLVAPATLKGAYGNLIDKMTSSPMKKIAECKKGFQFRLLKNPTDVQVGIAIKEKNVLCIYPAAEGKSLEFSKKGVDCAKKYPLSSQDMKNGKSWLREYGHSKGSKGKPEYRWVPVKYNYPSEYQSVRIKIDPSLSSDKILKISPKLLKIYKESWDRRDSGGNPFDAPEIEAGMAVFYLTDADNFVVAISPNFRLKWPFLDSVLYTDRYSSKAYASLRDQVGYMEGEALKGETKKRETRLTPRQKLFGYVFDRDMARRPEEEYLDSYAGRVHFNFAVCKPKREHIANDQKKLKILGSPQASSYEFYCKPLERDGARSIGDWGLPTVGRKRERSRLAGRKHYLHDPQAAIEPSQYVDDGSSQNRERKESKDNQFSVPLSFLKPDIEADGPEEAFPQFRFTVRFDRLERYELGMLYFVLNLSGGSDLSRIHACLRAKRSLEKLADSEILALKMGYARPLGFGSVLSTVEERSVRCALSLGEKREFSDDELDRAWIDRMKEWFLPKKEPDSIWNIAPHLQELKSLLLFRVHANGSESGFRFSYPEEKSAIYAYHMAIHKTHIERRMKNRKTLSPLPSAKEVWDRTLLPPKEILEPESEIAIEPQDDGNIAFSPKREGFPRLKGTIEAIDRGSGRGRIVKEEKQANRYASPMTFGFRKEDAEEVWDSLRKGDKVRFDKKGKKNRAIDIVPVDR